MHHCNLCKPAIIALSGSLSHILAHSRTFWLTLTQSGSLWLSQAHIGSQSPCSAHHIVAAWLQLFPPWSWVFSIPGGSLKYSRIQVFLRASLNLRKSIKQVVFQSIQHSKIFSYSGVFTSKFEFEEEYWAGGLSKYSVFRNIFVFRCLYEQVWGRVLSRWSFKVFSILKYSRIQVFWGASLSLRKSIEQVVFRITASPAASASCQLRQPIQLLDYQMVGALCWFDISGLNTSINLVQTMAPGWR